MSGVVDEGAPPRLNSDGEGQDDDDEKGGGKGATGKSRRELPAGAVATLKAWLLSPEHFTHPYPTPQDQIILMQKTGIDKKQLKNWFTNARRRIWKPMLKKQLEQGKLASTGAGGGGVAVPGVVPGLMAPPSGPVQLAPQSSSHAGEGASAPADNVQSMQAQYPQTAHQPQQTGYDAYGNTTYGQQQQQQQTQQQQQQVQVQQYSSYYPTQHSYGQQQSTSGSGANAPIAASNSIGSLPPMGGNYGGGSSTSLNTNQMNKTDSHAVLMELFARDQDLVRQATEGAKLKAAAAQAANQQHQAQMGAQHPMKLAAQGSRIGSVPALNSWPHFSSVSSLNNLGTMTGVKSITNMSGADLASQGNLNKKGNLAQVKSIESMGRADSFAFLEVFFDDKSGGAGAGSSASQRGTKRERDDDNDVGLSLDGDESPATNAMKSNEDSNAAKPTVGAGAPTPAPLPADGKDKEGTSDSGILKRAYDDALAARGLMSVSRSSERLTDLALPAKMQRTLSQEYLRQTSSSAQGQQYGTYYPASQGNQNTRQNGGRSYQQQQGGTQQYPGQNPGQQQHTYQGSSQSSGVSNSATPLSDPSMTSSSVEVPSTTKCSLCQCINVDTQLRPCGHMFHGRCLKPSLQNAVGPPQCPIDHIPMQSAVLAVPTDEQNSHPNSSQQQSWGSSHSFQSNPTVSAEASSGSA